MKWEILKGSEKDFEGMTDDILSILENDLGDRYPFHLSAIAPIGRWLSVAERRPITEPVVNQQLTTEWSGEGLPPVGTECELKSEEYADFDWVKVKVVFEHNGELIVIVNMPDQSIHDRMSKHSAGYDGAKFRPIRSPEDVARDEATKAMNKFWREHAGKEHNGKLFSIYEIIYDAIAAGKIPGVKLE